MKKKVNIYEVWFYAVSGSLVDGYEITDVFSYGEICKIPVDATENERKRIVKKAMFFPSSFRLKRMVISGQEHDTLEVALADTCAPYAELRYLKTVDKSDLNQVKNDGKEYLRVLCRIQAPRNTDKSNSNEGKTQ